MGFSIFCIIESCLLIANAIAILNERFLKRGKFLTSHKFNVLTPVSYSGIACGLYVFLGYSWWGRRQGTSCVSRDLTRQLEESTDHIFVHL